MGIITKNVLRKTYIANYLLCLISVFYINSIPCFGSKPIISAQVGDHPDYFRISLTWPDPVRFDYKVIPSGLEVRFFHTAELLIDRVVRVFPGSSYRQQADQTILTVRFSSNRKVEAKAYGNIIYLDIYKRQENTGGRLANTQSSTRPNRQPVKQFDASQLSDVNLQNLFRRVADYLGHAEPDTLSNIVTIGENTLLLKFSNAPIAVYEHEDRVNLIVLSDASPLIDKPAATSFSIELRKFDKGFLLQLPRKKFMLPNVTKTSEGWHIDFNRSLPQGEIPLLFTKGSEKSLIALRSGLFDPVTIDATTLVCCTLDPNVFVPFQLMHGNSVNIIATTAGAAFKLDHPSRLTLEREKMIVTIEDEDEINLPQDSPQSVRFNAETTSDSFLLRKKRHIAKLVESTSQAPSQHLELILLYLANGFASEAINEVEAYRYAYPEQDIQYLTLLRAIANTADNYPDYDVLEQMFPYHQSHIEIAAWYAFILSKLTSINIPTYLTSYLMRHISTFPNPLKSILLLDFADQMVRQNNLTQAEEALTNVSDHFLTLTSVHLKQFLEYRIQKLSTQQDHRLEMQRLLRHTQEPALIARIILEGDLIDLKQQQQHQLVDTLESLLPLIDGNIIHLKALDYLLNYYSNQKDFLAVLDKAMILQAKYPETYSQYKTKIQNIIEQIVRNKLYEKIGMIKTVNILNQFVDAIPPHVYMIDFILSLTRKVHLIGMLNEATKLLENYFRRTDIRLTSQKEMQIFLQLLDFYIKNNDEEKAQQLIEMIERRAVITKEDIETMNRLKARLALSKEKPDEALHLLEKTNSFEGLRLKSGLLWNKKRWAEAADALTELLDKHTDQMDEERKERYIIHLAAALVLNEKNHVSKQIGRGKTKLTLQEFTQKYASVLSKYKNLFEELITLPHDSESDILTKQLIENELKETDRLKKLFDHVKAIPTH